MLTYECDGFVDGVFAESEESSAIVFMNGLYSVLELEVVTFCHLVRPDIWEGRVTLIAVFRRTKTLVAGICEISDVSRGVVGPLRRR